MRPAIAVLLGGLVVFGAGQGLAQMNAVGQAPRIELFAPPPAPTPPAPTPPTPPPPAAAGTPPREPLPAPAAQPFVPRAAPPGTVTPAPAASAPATRVPVTPRPVAPSSAPAAASTPAPPVSPRPSPLAEERRAAPAMPQRSVAPAEPVAPAAGLANAPDPAIVADAFYRTYLAMRAPGVPSAEQRGRLRPFLSTTLDAELEAAEKAEQLYRAKTKGAAPALVEGDLFASLFEGATEVAVKECTTQPPFVRCPLQLAYSDSKTNQRVQWQDVLVLARQGGHWRVYDMAYQGEFGLGRIGTLREFLRIVVKESRE